MFGKPEWFRPKAFGWGLAPVARQGWIYTGVWTGVLVAPFLALLGMGKILEAIVWMAAAVGLLVWDVRQILQQIHQQKTDANLLYIRDEDEDPARLKTDKYDMHIRD